MGELKPMTKATILRPDGTYQADVPIGVENPEYIAYDERNLKQVIAALETKEIPLYWKNFSETFLIQMRYEDQVDSFVSKFLVDTDRKTWTAIAEKYPLDFEIRGGEDAGIVVYRDTGSQKEYRVVSMDGTTEKYVFPTEKVSNDVYVLVTF